MNIKKTIYSTLLTFLMLFNATACQLPNNLLSNLSNNEIDDSESHFHNNISESHIHSESYFIPSEIYSETYSENEDIPHEHTYSSVFSYNTQYHWKEAICGHDLTIEYNNHIFSNWKIVKEASTNEEGLKERYCEYCDYYQQEVIEKIQEHVHSPLIIHTKTNATCENDGIIEYTCECGEYFQEVHTKAYGHDIVSINQFDANYHWTFNYCSRCNSINEKVNYSNHNIISNIITEPTEQETGLKEEYCSDCNYKKKIVLPKKEHVHNYNKVDIIEPTCVKEGYSKFTCSCGDYYHDDYVEAIGHSLYVDTVLFDKESTIAYYMSLKCNNCDEQFESKNQSVDTIEISRVEPTCTESGVIYKEASTYIEGERYSSNFEIYIDPAHDFKFYPEYNYDEFGNVVSYAPHILCNNCPYIVYESDSLKEELIGLSMPTCNSEGFAKYRLTADYFGVIYTDEYTNIIPKEDHDLKPVFFYDYESYQLKEIYVKCHNYSCPYVEYVDYQTKEIEYVSPTCEENGKRVIESSCTYNGQYYCETQEFIIEKLGHDYSAKFTWYPNFAPELDVAYICNNDNNHVLDSLEYSYYFEITKYIEPTCEEDGYISYVGYSTYDGVTYEEHASFVLEKLGHNYVDYHCENCDDYYYSEGLKFSDKGDGTYMVGLTLSVTDKVVVIPKYYNNKPVTELYECEYGEFSNVEEIFIPDGFTTLTDYSIRNYPNLKRVRIPDSIEYIGTWVFRNCDNLEFNEYKNGLYIGSVNNPYFMLYKLIDKDVETLEFHENTKHIGREAFDENHSIKYLSLPNGIKIIGNSTFYDCRSLISIEIPNSVTRIGEDAFNGCSSLERITIPSSVKYIGANPFVRCNSFREIDVDDDNMNYKDIDGVLYDYNLETIICYPSALENESFIMPDTVKFIEDSAFWCCDSLVDVSIGNNVFSIGRQAFYDCSNLKNVSIPNSVTRIEYGAFEYCYSLTNISFSENLEYIGEWAFGGCSSLEKLELPSSIESIPYCGFYSCSALKEVIIPEGIKTINNSAFKYCYNLVYVYIPSTITNIYSNPFSNCESLENIEVSEENYCYDSYEGSLYEEGYYKLIRYASELVNEDYGVFEINLPYETKIIGDYAFSGIYLCDSYLNLENIERIDSYAFENAYLDSIILNEVYQISETAFIDAHINKIDIIVEDENDYQYYFTDGFSLFESITDSLIYCYAQDISYYEVLCIKEVRSQAFSASSINYIYFEYGLETIDDYSFLNNNYTYEITIPSSVTYIGENAFSYCYNLSTIHFEGSEEQWNEIAPNLIFYTDNVVITFAE